MRHVLNLTPCQVPPSILFLCIFAVDFCSLNCSEMAEFSLVSDVFSPLLVHSLRKKKQYHAITSQTVNQKHYTLQKCEQITINDLGCKGTRAEAIVSITKDSTFYILNKVQCKTFNISRHQRISLMNS